MIRSFPKLGCGVPEGMGTGTVGVAEAIRGGESGGDWGWRVVGATAS
jgi:hypothetical protein